MVVRSLALKTALAIQRAVGVVEDKDGYSVLRTPLVTDYWYGNCLAMTRPPRDGDYGAWMRLFETELPGNTHRVFLFDGADGDTGDSRAFIDNGFELNVRDVLTVIEPKRPEGITAAFSYRRFGGDADWAAGVETSVTINGNTPGYTRSYIERTFAATRLAVERGDGDWWGAWDGERNVAQMGLFHKDGLARFKDVETHPEYRRRGACRSLLFHVCDDARRRFGSPIFVIVPEDDSVRRIYEAVGFSFRERVVDYSRHPVLV